MQFVSFRAHAVMDYLLSVFMVLMPWIFGFAHDPTAKWVTIGFGGAYFLETLLTGYKLTPFHWFKLYEHLSLDAVWGLVLCVSPWVFGFNEVVYLPHMLIGMMMSVVPLFTILPEEKGE